MAEKKPLGPIESAPESQSLGNVTPEGQTPPAPPPTNEEVAEKPTMEELKDTIAKEVLTSVPMEKFLVDPKMWVKDA